jgi:hypothetical protein
MRVADYIAERLAKLGVKNLQELNLNYFVHSFRMYNVSINENCNYWS